MLIFNLTNNSKYLHFKGILSFAFLLKTNSDNCSIIWSFCQNVLVSVSISISFSPPLPCRINAECLNFAGVPGSLQLIYITHQHTEAAACQQELKTEPEPEPTESSKWLWRAGAARPSCGVPSLFTNSTSAPGRQKLLLTSLIWRGFLGQSRDGKQPAGAEKAKTRMTTISDE